MHSMCHKVCTYALCVHVSACAVRALCVTSMCAAVHVLDRFLYIYFKAGEYMYIDLRFSSTCPSLLPPSL